MTFSIEREGISASIRNYFTTLKEVYYKLLNVMAYILTIKEFTMGNLSNHRLLLIFEIMHYLKLVRFIDGNVKGISILW